MDSNSVQIDHQHISFKQHQHNRITVQQHTHWDSVILTRVEGNKMKKKIFTVICDYLPKIYSLNELLAYGGPLNKFMWEKKKNKLSKWIWIFFSNFIYGRYVLNMVKLLTTMFGILQNTKHTHTKQLIKTYCLIVSMIEQLNVRVSIG